MEHKKIALITGISGMDGSYLAELLLDKNYKVHGIIRRSSTINTKRLDGIYNNPNLLLHYGDLNDASFINKIIIQIEPDEIYNLGAMSHGAVSFQNPEYTTDIDAVSFNGAFQSMNSFNTFESTNQTKKEVICMQNLNF